MTAVSSQVGVVRATPRSPNAYVSTYAELSRRVREAGLLRRRYGYYWTLITVTAVSFAAVWYLVVAIGDSWFQLLAAALLALVSSQVGFLGHDAAHRQVFASHRWNEWTARILSGAFAGLSLGWWMTKHNRHHAAPNQEGKDPDVAPGALVFTPSASAARSPRAALLRSLPGLAVLPAADPGRAAPARQQHQEAAGPGTVQAPLGGSGADPGPPDRWHGSAVPAAAAGEGLRLPRRSTPACSASCWAARSPPTTRACRSCGGT